MKILKSEKLNHFLQGQAAGGCSRFVIISFVGDLTHFPKLSILLGKFVSQTITTTLFSQQVEELFFLS